MWFHKHQLFQISSYSVLQGFGFVCLSSTVTELAWPCALVLGLCLHTPGFLFFAFLESEQCEVSMLIVCNIHTSLSSILDFPSKKKRKILEFLSNYVFI